MPVFEDVVTETIRDDQLMRFTVGKTRCVHVCSLMSTAVSPPR